MPPRTDHGLQHLSPQHQHAQAVALLDRVRAVLQDDIEIAVVFRTVVEAIVETFGYTQVSIYLCRNEQLILQYQSGYAHVLDTIPFSQGVMGRVVRNGEPVLLADVQTDSAFLGAIPGVMSEVCVPLIDQTQVVGVLNIESVHGRQLTQDDFRLLCTLGEYVSIALRLARLYLAAVEHERKYQSVFDHVREVVFQLDSNDCWTLLNTAWTTLTGFAIDAAIGSTILTFVSPLDHHVLGVCLDALRSGRRTTEQCDIRIRTASGALRWVDAHLYAITDNAGRMLGISGLLNDITERRQAENALRKERDFSAAVLDTAGSLIIVVDCTGHIVRFNQACEQATGYTFDEVRNRIFWDILLLTDDQATVAAMFNPIDISRIPSQHENTWVSRDGGHLRIAWDNTVILDDHGSIEYVIGTGIDITARRYTEEALLRTVATKRALINAMPDMLLQVMPDGMIVQCHGADNGALPHGRAFVAGSTLHDVFGAQLAPAALQYVQHALTQGLEQRWEYHLAGDAEERDYEVRIVMTDEGDIFMIIRDMTELKRIDRLKNEFVAVVSHELRTPLTSIKGSLGLMAGGVTGPMPLAAQDMLAIAHKNCDRLLRLINDILDVEQMEAGTMRFAFLPVDLVALMHATVEANRSYAAAQSVQLVTETVVASVLVAGDADRLMQALTNLVSNAVKFSPPGATVVVALAVETATVRLSVRDHGAGIPLEFQPQLFKKFMQADSSDRRRTGGTGLGLSITKAIVERHGGRVSFSTACDRGTTFFLDVPFVYDINGAHK